MKEPTKLIDMSISAARMHKWRLGQEKYGTEFVGDPLEHLDSELIDAMNYATVALKRGLPMGDVIVQLNILCDQVRAIYSKEHS